MAEIIGVVASGISIAQVAGKILSTGLEIKCLLDDMTEIPGRLADLLDQVTLLAAIISEISLDDDFMPASYQASQNRSLRNAVTYCQKAADQLAELASSLSAQVQTTRGFKRKLGLAKAVLRKEQLAKLENRLSTAVQLLSLAQQTYMFLFQRLQPSIIASHIQRSLEARPSSESEILATQTSRGTSRALSHTKTTVPKRAQSHRFGLRAVTGEMEVQLPSHSLVSYQDTHGVTDRDEVETVVMLRLKMPSWVSSTIIDAAMNRSLTGWTYSFKAYKVHHVKSEQWDTAWRLIQADKDVSELRRLFQDRKLSPLDRFYWRDAGHEISLLSIAISSGAWRICDYLLDFGAEQIIHTIPATMWQFNDDTGPGLLRKCLGHNNMDDNTRFFLLMFYQDSAESFAHLRRKLWLDSEFYSDDFRNRRLAFAAKIAALGHMRSNQGNIEMSQPAIFRQMLSQSAQLRRTDLYTDQSPKTFLYFMRVLSCCAGRVVSRSSQLAEAWYTVMREILGVVVYDADLLSQFESLSRSGDLLALSYRSFYARPIKEVYRKYKIQARLEFCTKAVKSWLTLLEQCGLDLEKYGAQEKHRASQHSAPRTIRIFRDVWYDMPRTFPELSLNSQMETRLISFEYGSRVDDWKLWWSEPTDELVGDFWKEIEPEEEMLYIPGSWVEEDDCA